MPDFGPFAAWSCRKRIPLPIPEANLTDFPVKVPIVGGSPESIAIGAGCLANGHDIRFAAADGVTELPYERESFAVVAGEATGIFWVKSDVSTAGTYVWMFYGNASASDGENATAVWDAYYKAVYHMKDAEDTSHIHDSTLTALTGTKKAAANPAQGVGQIGMGQVFDGSDDYISMATPTALQVAEKTISFWAKPHVTVGANWPLFSLMGGNYYVGFNQDDRLFASWFNTALTQKSADLSNVDTVITSWQHYTFTFFVSGSDVTVKAFINGVAQLTAQESDGYGSSYGSVLIIGAFSTTPGNNLDGEMDEVRFSQVRRSDAWIKFEYANMAADDGGLTWGEEEHWPNPQGGGKPMNLKLKL